MDSQTKTAKRPHTFYAALLIALTLWMSIPGIWSIPVIDRDEARYAQATVQMVDSGDYVNIKFQDRSRNKKPAGIYWMQAATVKAFTDPNQRAIWANRLPSILAGLIAVLATYWGGILILGRRGAFISAGLLATSALFVFETHIAKTDAMLCAMSAVTLACLIRQRSSPKPYIAILFWAAIGVGIMIKGPIVPLLVILTCGALFIWERNTAWMKSLTSWPGIALSALIVLPWFIMIGLSTGGAFFAESVGQDLLPKVMGGQEKHGAAPGYYALTLPLLFWPGSLFLLCGLIFGVRAARSKDAANPALASSMRLLLTWVIPFWILLELVPTKLPNYLLPVYPALALMCGGAITALLQIDAFKTSRRISAALFFVISILLLTIILSSEAAYAASQDVSMWIGLLCLALIFIAAGSLWGGRTKAAMISGLGSALVLSTMTYLHILPRLETLFVSHRVEAQLTAAGVTLPRNGGPQIMSPHFTEPSLVYRLGTDILLGDKADLERDADRESGQIWLLDTAREEVRLKLQALKPTHCFDEITEVSGINYSKGDPVTLSALALKPCVKTETASPVNPETINP